MSDAAMGFLHVGVKVHETGDDVGGLLAQLVHFKQPRREDAMLPGHRTKDGGRS